MTEKLHTRMMEGAATALADGLMTPDDFNKLDQLPAGYDFQESLLRGLAGCRRFDWTLSGNTITFPGGTRRYSDVASGSSEQGVTWVDTPMTKTNAVWAAGDGNGVMESLVGGNSWRRVYAAYNPNTGQSDYIVRAFGNFPSSTLLGAGTVFQHLGFIYVKLSANFAGGRWIGNSIFMLDDIQETINDPTAGLLLGVTNGRAINRGRNYAQVSVESNIATSEGELQLWPISGTVSGFPSVGSMRFSTPNYYDFKSFMAPGSTVGSLQVRPNSATVRLRFYTMGYRFLPGHEN